MAIDCISNKERLRIFISQYGELAFLKDLAGIFHDLGVEWFAANERVIGYTFSDSANMIADVASRLEQVEQIYTKT